MFIYPDSLASLRNCPFYTRNPMIKKVRLFLVVTLSWLAILTMPALLRVYFRGQSQPLLIYYGPIQQGLVNEDSVKYYLYRWRCWFIGLREECWCEDFIRPFWHLMTQHASMHIRKVFDTLRRWREQCIFDSLLMIRSPTCDYSNPLTSGPNF